jgi:hypothetical protein
MAKPSKAKVRAFTMAIADKRDNLENELQEFRDLINDWEPKEFSQGEDQKAELESAADDVEQAMDLLSSALETINAAFDLHEE